MQTIPSVQHKRSFDRSQLENGITAIAIENQAADIITARLFLKAGGRWEPEGKAGLTHLLASVLTKGTEQLSSVQLAEAVESVGANLGASTASDYFLIGLKTVTADFRFIFELAAQLLRSPAFPEAEVALEQRLTLQHIRAQQEQPFNVGYEQLRRAIYRNHPYGTSILGTAESVESLTRDDLQAFHRTYFRPDNLVVSISGRIAPDAAIDLVRQVLGDWRSPPTPLPVPQLPEIAPNPSQVCFAQETQQSIVMLGYLTASASDPDYIPLKLLNTYLGNGLSSRLFVELREKRGLAYDVSAFYPTRLDASAFVTYMGTAPDNTAIALDGLYREVKRLCQTHLTPEELQAAKNKLLGQYALGKQTNAELAQIFGWYEAIGVGVEFDLQFQEAVRQLDSETLKQVANRHFQGNPYTSIVGPATAIERI